jgi:WD40 repeat protein
VTGSWDRTVQVWDLTTGHTSRANSVHKIVPDFTLDQVGILSI